MENYTISKECNIYLSISSLGFFKVVGMLDLSFSRLRLFCDIVFRLNISFQTEKSKQLQTEEKMMQPPQVKMYKNSKACGQRVGGSSCSLVTPSSRKRALPCTQQTTATIRWALSYKEYPKGRPSRTQMKTNKWCIKTILGDNSSLKIIIDFRKRELCSF